jgi:hypothetical protein
VKVLALEELGKYDVVVPIRQDKSFCSYQSLHTLFFCGKEMEKKERETGGQTDTQEMVLKSGTGNLSI